MDGLFHGSKPYEQMGWFGGEGTFTTPIFGVNIHTVDGWNLKWDGAETL